MECLMSINPLQTYSPQKSIYKIHDGLRVTVAIDKNPYRIPLDVLFSMAARKNPKRQFLFVSKVLGKHIPVSPLLPLLSGAALALQYLKIVFNISIEYENDIIEAVVCQKKMKETYTKLKLQPFPLPEKAVFIGFAETATALGHSMFDCFSDNGIYIHTTREAIVDLETVISFEEEHSHATAHRLYSSREDLLKTQAQVVLIDDEITTGKTALNIIEAIQAKYPRKRYVVVSLLDWRSEEERDKFIEMEKRLNIEIVSVALISGTISINEEEIYKTETDVPGNYSTLPTRSSETHYIDLSNLFKATLHYSSINSLGEINNCPYLSATGRFSISSVENKDYIGYIHKIAPSFFIGNEEDKILCLGTGEFMFLPMQLAAAIKGKVSYQSTTRSPIHAINKENYGVLNAFSFENTDEPSLINYLYNIPINYYDRLYLFLEREVSEERLKPILQTLNNLGIPQIFVVNCSLTDKLERGPK